MRRIYSVMCKCLNKIYCRCVDNIFPTSHMKNDVETWKRIEGIDQYIKKRY